MHYLNICIIVIIALGGIIKECNGKSTIDFNNLHIETNHTCVIKDSVDLEGQIIELPPDVTFCAYGGLISNGTLVGNNTKITGDEPLFDHVTIKGSWIVPHVSTKLFKDLSYENALQDLIGLTSPEINNMVYIPKGNYKVNAKTGGAGLTLKSNTVLVLDGDIELIPNSFDICYIALIKDVYNITIMGNGSLIGDKDKHLGSSGEWGMGVHILNSKKVNILGISIKDCWGDCIYIGQESENVQISKCKLENARRQGISITSARNVNISHCKIKNIHGTPPEFAIDIEPNKLNMVEQVSISNVQVQDCGGGITVYGDARGAIVKGVSVKNCIVAGRITIAPYLFSTAEGITIQKCKSDANVPRSLYARHIKGLQLQGNILSATTDDVIKIDNCKGVIQNGNRLLRTK